VPTKKTKRRRPGGAEQHERRQQRLEQRRAARAAAIAAAERARRRRALIRRVLFLVLVLSPILLFVFFRPTAPTQIEGHDIETFSMSGENQHQQGDLDYPTDPPVSGVHAPVPAGCGTYAQPVPDESQVHTLEHGAVGIQYRPELDRRSIATIEDIVRNYGSHVFSAPRPGMGDPIVVTSWGRMMRLEALDASAIRSYIDEFRMRGPEDQDCDVTVDERFRPRPAPSPTADERESE
jgi:uncharacterized protein DUF3105